MTIYGWAITFANLAYPLHPDTDDLSNAWGGPTLADAWAVPALGGLLFAFVTPAVVRLLATVQARLLRALVGQCASRS